MSKRVLALVRRSGGGTSITDTTPTVVYEHEVPLLEVIHGEGAVDVIQDTDQLLDPEVRKDRAKQIEHIVNVNKLGQEFEGDAREEYQRLSIKFGMCADVPQLVVEKVYGVFAEGRFTRALGVRDYDSMSMSELREACEELGITHKASDKKVQLIDAIRAVKSAAAEEADVSNRIGRAA